MVILGGAKVSDKINVINALLEKADTIIIGGGMAYTFRKLVQGITLGKSLYKPEWEPIAQAALDKAKERGVKFLIPVDALITDNFDFEAMQVGNTKIHRPWRKHPGRLGRRGYRAGIRETVQRRNRQRQDRPLERPDGRL